MTRRVVVAAGSTSSLRRAAIGALTVVVAVALSAPAAAHSDLRTSRPVDGQTVSSPLTQVDLVFWASVSGSAVTVKDPEGSLVPGQASQVDDVTVRFAMAPTTVSGPYTVEYRLTSGDGDPVSGSIAFTYAPSPPGPGAARMATAVIGLAIAIWLSGRVVRRRLDDR